MVQVQAVLDAILKRRQQAASGKAPAAERVWRRREDDDDATRLFSVLQQPVGSGGAEELALTGDALQLLFARPELARRRDAYGRLPIHVAALFGHLEVLEALLEIDRSFAAATSSTTGMTALHFGALGNQYTVVRALLRAAGPRLALIRSAPSSHPQAPDGLTPTELASKHGFDEIAALLHSAALGLPSMEPDGHYRLDQDRDEDNSYIFCATFRDLVPYKGESFPARLEYLSSTRALVRTMPSGASLQLGGYTSSTNAPPLEALAPPQMSHNHNLGDHNDEFPESPNSNSLPSRQGQDQPQHKLLSSLAASRAQR